MQDLAGIFMGAVQYNEEGVFMSISDLCEVMTSTNGTCQKPAGAYNRLVKLAQVFYTPTDKLSSLTNIQLYLYLIFLLLALSSLHMLGEANPPTTVAV